MSVFRDREEPESVTKAKLELLRGYRSLRRRPWLFPFIVAGVCFAIGFVFDPSRPLYDHGVFAGMFMIWGATAVVFGVLTFAIIKGLVLWSRYTEEQY